MALAGIALLAPAGLLGCLLALLPLAIVVAVILRQRRVALLLGLEPAPWRRGIAAVALPTAGCVLFGVALAQPALGTTSRLAARTSSQIVFVTDVSDSMRASAGPGDRTRLDAAREVVTDLRASVPAVPAGLTGLTDRALPYLFPTLDRRVFADALATSVRVNAPTPQQVSAVATSYAPLAGLVRDGFFAPGTAIRTCVLVTDGETRSDLASTAALRSSRGCRLLVVRVGSPGDRIFRKNGDAESGYRPEASAASTIERLARVSGGAAFEQGDLGAARTALREAAETGPLETVGLAERRLSLAPLFALLGFVFVVMTVFRARRTAVQRFCRTGSDRYDAVADV